MDSIRVAKVENVVCAKTGSGTSSGTVHLTAHHLIFRNNDTTQEELWIPYPLMSLVSRLPQTLKGKSPVLFHTRTYESFCLSFPSEGDASDVFESVKDLTVAASIEKLYAFYYTPTPPLPTSNGWSIYTPREEFGRMGIGSRTKAWRFTDINKDYSFCPTYPARMVVPTRISDTTLQYAAKYRSKARIPVLSYLHWANFGSITRCSQPMVGLTQNRSIQDEKLIEAIFQSHHNPESRVSTSPIYGATATNLIIDARPTTNAVANTAKGAGTENMDNYKDCKKAYLGIDNIHTMRDSLSKVVDALREADSLVVSMSNDLSGNLAGLAVLDRQALRRSGWLRHLYAIMEGTLLIVKNIHINSSHVLVHCSDGWDRTAQLSSLCQICLDPYYRTIRGFEVLVEKEWAAYGHKFQDRCGHLSSDKFFVSPSEPGGGASGAEAFLASVQNRFASQGHLKETSPVFHQFLECTRQIQRQLPNRFEYNERFLRQVYYHLYSCQFGTFLYNCERERRLGTDGRRPATETTVSAWDFFNSPEEMELNTNPTYDTSLDDPANRSPDADMGVLLPNSKDVRFWNELYGRTDEEMNGRVVRTQIKPVEAVGPIESEQDDPVLRVETPLAVPLPPSPAPGASSTPTLPPQEATSPPLSNVLPEPVSPRRELPVRPQPDRPDSFRPFPNTSSALSMRSSSTTPDSPFNRGRGGDFLGNGGMKSMWGKLSSNASAAFSVVQDAYIGVAKDFLTGNESAGEGSDSRNQELKGRDALPAWGDISASASTSTPPRHQEFTSPLDSDTLRLKMNSLSATLPHLPTDNPWNSVRSPASPLTQSTQSADLNSLFRSDPSVAQPVPRKATSPLSFGESKDAANGALNSASSTTSLPALSSSLSLPPQGTPQQSRVSEAEARPSLNEYADPLGVWAS